MILLFELIKDLKKIKNSTTEQNVSIHPNTILLKNVKSPITEVQEVKGFTNFANN